jgi:hypothetical protein
VSDEPVRRAACTRLMRAARRVHHRCCRPRNSLRCSARWARRPSGGGRQRRSSQGERRRAAAAHCSRRAAESHCPSGGVLAAPRVTRPMPRAHAHWRARRTRRPPRRVHSAAAPLRGWLSCAQGRLRHARLKSVRARPFARRSHPHARTAGATSLARPSSARRRARYSAEWLRTRPHQPPCSVRMQPMPCMQPARRRPAVSAAARAQLVGRPLAASPPRPARPPPLAPSPKPPLEPAPVLLLLLPALLPPAIPMQRRARLHASGLARRARKRAQR